MADGTKIEWTDATWNPITGCSVISPGCTNCYAMRLAGTRMKTHPSRAGLTIDSKAGPVWNGQLRFNEQWLLQPLQWNKPRRIFVCAHGDLFHENVVDDWLDKVFAIMALNPHHTFQVLTKRAGNMRRYLADPQTPDGINEWCDKLAPGHWHRRELYDFHDGLPLKNVWLGVSCETQEWADKRVPDLLATPAAVRWVSAEPLLGPIDFTCLHYDGLTNIDALTGRHGLTFGGECNRLDWIVAGGESGAGARPMHPDWVRSIRDQCAGAGVAFHFKQWGEHQPLELIDDGRPEPWRRSSDGIRECWALDELSRPRGSLPKITFSRIGKRKAGRFLDGVLHDSYPEEAR